MNRLIFLNHLLSHDETVSQFSDEVKEAFKHINCVGKILTTIDEDEAKKVCWFFSFEFSVEISYF